MWQFFHKLGSPKWFFGIAARLMPWLLAGGILLLMAGIVWGLAFAPKDYLQGNSYRIIFIHVPTAFLAQSVYVMMAVAAVVTLVWRMKLADVFVKSVAPVGLVLTFLSLFTGAVWGKPTWGTWWVWDARLTSMLILFFLYLGYMALRDAFDEPGRGARASAILVLVGFVNVPIIKFSVDWWNTLHQPSSVLRMDGPTIHPDMLTPLFLMAAAFQFYYFWLVLVRIRRELMVNRTRALRHRQAAA